MTEQIHEPTRSETNLRKLALLMNKYLEHDKQLDPENLDDVLVFQTLHELGTPLRREILDRLNKDITRTRTTVYSNAKVFLAVVGLVVAYASLRGDFWVLFHNPITDWLIGIYNAVLDL